MARRRPRPARIHHQQQAPAGPAGPDARHRLSPALRTEQTAQALDHKLKRRAELLPGGPPGDLLAMDGGACAIRKGAVWWLRQRLNQHETLLLAVMTPNCL